MMYYIDVVIPTRCSVAVEARNMAEAITSAMGQLPFIPEPEPADAVRRAKRGRVPGYVRAVLRARRHKG